MPSKTREKNAAIAARSAALPKIPKELLDCSVPCDHWPIRSWPLFRARQVMREVMSSQAQRSAT